MPTCKESTVKLIDRGGGLSKDSARVQFTFRDGPVKNSEVIAAVRIVEDGASTPKEEAITAANAPWQIFGSTEVGEGELVHGGGSEQRIFLITKLRRQSGGAQQQVDAECCEATELVCVKSFAELTMDELILMARRLHKLLVNQRRQNELDCNPPLGPG
jgi:hypothetical protein